jgi:hypothetical protein
MTIKRALKLLALTVLLLFLALLGTAIYGIFNPAFVLRDAVAEYPAPDTPQLTESFALACAEQIMAKANLAEEFEPFEDDRADQGDRYLLRDSTTSGSIMFTHKTLGDRRFVHIELIEGTAHCELWRGK